MTILGIVSYLKSSSKSKRNDSIKSGTEDTDSSLLSSGRSSLSSNSIHSSSQPPASLSPQDINNISKTITRDSESSDWKAKLNGDWRLVREVNADAWFTNVNGFNFFKRKIACSALMTLTKTIHIKNNVFNVERCFSGKRKYWKESLQIGKSRDTAESKRSVMDGDSFTVRCWADEEKKIIYLYMEPIDKKNGLKVVHARRLTDDDEIEMVC